MQVLIKQPPFCLITVIFFALLFQIASFFASNVQAQNTNWQELFQKGAIAMQTGDTTNALLFLEQSLPLQEKDLAINDPIKTNSYLVTVVFLSQVHQSKGNVAQIDTLFAKSTAYVRGKHGKNNVLYAMLLGQQAMFFDSRAMYGKAQGMHIESLDILKEIEGDQSMMYAIGLSNFAKSYYSEGKFSYAEPLWNDAAVILRPLKNNTLFALTYLTAISNLANLYHKVNFFSKSDTLFQEAQTLYKKVANVQTPDYAQLLNDYAALSQDAGNYTKAEILLVESLKITSATRKSVQYYISLNNLGALYQTLGNPDKARPLFEEAMLLIDTLKGKTSADYATACNNLAEVYRSLSLTDQAIPLYKTAKEISAHNKDEKYFAVLNNLGELERLRKQFAESEKYFKEIIEASEKMSNFNNNYLLIAKNNLALLYLEMGKPDSAENLFAEIAGDSERSFGKEHPAFLAAINNFALAYYQKKQYEKASLLFMQSAQSILSSIKENFSSLSESEKRKYWLAYYPYIYNFHAFITEVVQNSNDLSVLPSLLQTALDLQLNSKGMLLEESQKIKQKIWQSKDVFLNNQFEQWQKLKTKIATSSLAKTSDLAQLEKQASDLEKQITLRSSLFKSLINSSSSTYSHLQEKLKDGEAVIEMIKTASLNKENKEAEFAYLAILLTNNQISYALVPQGRELETEKYQIYNNQIQTQKAIDEWSYEPFWKEIDIKLKQMFGTQEIQKIYFCPEGIYHNINIQLLYKPLTKKYLIDEYENIHQVTNLKEILMQSTPNESKEAVFFGRPLYDPQKTNPKEKTPKKDLNATEIAWEDLLNTEKEVLFLSSLFTINQWRTEKFLGAQASEEQVKLVKNPKILHIATHGHFSKQSKLSGMLNSGLIFAGVNLKEKTANSEDGVLTALEASALNLGNTDLVVLSACKTALGDLATGEGVYGLQRGFKVAGAKTILTSLWSVDDEITEKLMREFYSLVFKGFEKRKAFRFAQLAIRKNYKSMKYWGAFVMVGE